MLLIPKEHRMTGGGRYISSSPEAVIIDAGLDMQIMFLFI